MKRGRPRHDDILTPREWEVLELLRLGLTNDGIAERLAISANTAKFHVSEILTKLGVSTREEAAAWQPSAPARLRVSLPFMRWLWTGSSFVRGIGLAVAVGAGLIVLVLALSGYADADRYAAGPLGKIAYIRDGDVWMKALPNGTPQRLTHDGGNSAPAWSNDGNWLLYFDAEVTLTDTGPIRGISVMRADGTGVRRLDGSGIWASLLLGTGEIIYSIDDLIVIEQLDGSGRRELRLSSAAGPGEQGSVAGLVPSPDGAWFAYVDERRLAGQEPGHSVDGEDVWSYRGLWVVRSDGTNAHEVFELGPQSSLRIFPHGWSPDDSLILFSLVSVTNSYDEFVDGTPLKGVALQGGAVQDLGITTSAVWSSWSVNGDSMAMVTGTGRESWAQKQIVVLDAGEDMRTPLTGPEIAAVAPAFSHDGTQIAYASSLDGGAGARDAALAARRIWLMDADGSNRRQLTAGEGFRDDAPMWSADGNHVLFARLSSEPCTRQYDLMLMDLTGAKLDTVEAALPLFDTRNRGPVIGEIPECPMDSNWSTDTFGRLNLGPVFDWWQQSAR